MGKIFKNITNKDNYVILYGEKDLEKINFSESLCVYLNERKIINNYKIYRINSDIDYIYMEENIKSEISGNNKINIEIIKFDNIDEKNNFNNLLKIFNTFINTDKYKDKLYFIFVFDINDIKNKNVTKIINENENLKKIIKNDENTFYAGLHEKYSKNLLKYLTNNLSLDKTERDEILALVKHKPKKIKKISEYLLNGKKIEEIKDILKKKKFYMPDKEIIENKKLYSLYLLLLNMPSGLPDSFLNILFDDYNKLLFDNKNTIIKSKENNWNIINENKKYDKKWNEIEYIEKIYEYLYKLLIIYTKLLNYVINKNKYKINYENGNTHYIFNSYSNRNIWECSIPTTINFEYDILNEEFDIKMHKYNIINLIHLIIKEIDNLRTKEETKIIDFYLENILLLFPSYFFLDKENINILNICINFSDKLNNNNLNYKLLLFLYSINENISEIKKKMLYNIYNTIKSKELKLELNILEEIRKKEKNINKLNELIKQVNSDEMKFNLYREIAIYYYQNNNYEESLYNLKIIIDSINNENIQKYRAIIDYCYILNKIIKNELKEKNNVNQ